MPLARKLLLGLLAVLAVVTVIGALTMRAATDRLEEAARSGLEVSGRLEAARINDRLDVLEGEFDDLVTNPTLSSAVDDGAGSESLQESTVVAVQTVRAVGNQVQSLAIVTPEGEVLGASDAVPPLDPAFLEQASRSLTYGPARRVAAGDDRLLVAQPLPTSTPVIAVAEFDLEPFRRLVAAHNGIGETSEAHLAQNLGGNAQFLTPLRFRPEDISFDLTVSQAQVAMPIVRSLNSPQTTVISAADYRQMDTLAAITTIDRTGWGLVVKLDESEALASAASVTRLLVGGWALAAALASATMLVMIRQHRRRVDTVKSAAMAIGGGDLDRRIGPIGGDEIGQIAAAIDHMASDLAADRRRREEAEAFLSHQARHDQLTGLPNRAAALAEVHASLVAREQTTALLFLDLDGFKAINDRYGHDGGDQLLVTVADRLRRTVPKESLVARFGGDEFLIVADADDALTIAEQIRRTIRRPIDIGVAVVEIDTSIGLATASDQHTADQLVRDADLAMYRDKQEHRASARSGVEVDGPTIDELRTAIETDQLSVVYQPIVDLEAERIIGVEALARWDHPRFGRVPAGRWIPLARAAGLLATIDRANITTAIAQLGEWRRSGRLDRTFVLSVNLASESVPTVIDHLGEELFKHGVPPHQLQVEITEEDFGERREHIERRLWALHRLGARLAIDDFGIVHSNLDRLRRLPVSTIKIDQSFVRDLPESDEDRAIVRAVLAMSAELGMSVVAEGVEQPSQAQELLDLGCRMAQGFHLGTPRPAEELELVGSTGPQLG
ncbi:MAG: EAL domain-containing protein [Actinomycetota bacterium]